MQVTVDIHLDPHEFIDSQQAQSNVPHTTIVQEPAALSLVAAMEQYTTNHLPARNLASRTREEYTADLRQAFGFLTHELGIVNIGAVERCHLERFLADLDRRGLMGSSRRRKLCSLRSFFGYVHDAGGDCAEPNGWTCHTSS